MFLRGLVEAQFNGSHVGRAVVFFLIPTILWVAFSSVFGFKIDAPALGLSVGLGLLSWLVMSGLLVVLIKLFKGRDANAKFSSILCAFSVNYLIAAVSGLLIIGIIFVAIPGLFQKVSSLQGQEVDFEQMVSVVGSLALPSDIVVLGVFALTGIIALIASLTGVYVIYRIGSLARETSRFSNLVFTAIALGLMIAADYALRAITGSFL